MSLSLTVHGLTLEYETCSILNQLECKIQPGELVALLGANGAGKSTLLRCLSKTISPTTGTIYLDSTDIHKLPNKKLARSMAVVPQESQTDFDFTVEDIVLMGRLPHLSRFQKEGKSDKEQVQKALKMTGVEHLSQRSITTLSGGEKQRVIIARAICQEPEILLFDEPTAGLDIGYQYEILELATRLNKEKGITVITAIHDLNLAARFFDRFILLSEGKILSAGNAEEVLTPKNINKAYGVNAFVYRQSLDGKLQVNILKKEWKDKNPDKSYKIHVIGGGEEALYTLTSLYQDGYSLSLGPVSSQDSGYKFATAHDIPAISVPPFSPVSESTHNSNLEFMRKADAVVLPPIHFGEINLCNLKAVEKVLDEGIPVIIVSPEDFKERDHTRGKAVGIIDRLLIKGAFQVHKVEKISNLFEQLLSFPV